MGSLVDQTQMERVLSYIDAGRGEGAELRAGGTRAREESGGFYVEPTIFGGARNDMKIAREEIFGPVVTAIPFGSEEDGIRIANDTIYGLTSGVWTRDINKAHRFARAVRSGTVCINCYDRGDNSLAVRRLQAVGHRPRQVAARARELHAAEDDVHQRARRLVAPIAEDDPRAGDVTALLARHLAFAHATTAPEDVFALDVDALVDPDVAFFSCRDDDGAVLGVGALKRLDAGHAEIKSMHTAEEARGRGVGRAMVEHLLAAARERGFERVSLETGAGPAFAPARALYARAGFTPCGAFGGYVPSPNSAYMTRTL